MPATKLTVTIRVELEEVPGKGWVAHASEVPATAQGATQEEALANLREVIEAYPEVVQSLIEKATKAHRFEIEPVPA